MKSNLFFRKREEEEYNGPTMIDPVTKERILLDVQQKAETHQYQPIETNGKVVWNNDNTSITTDITGEEIITGFYSESEEYKDMSKSIFKMEEYMATMPESLPMDVKLLTVVNVLLTSGFIPADLIEDGRGRMDYISTRRDQILKSNNDRISYQENEIENLKSLIDEHKQAILEMKKENDEVEKAVQTETARINQLINNIMSTSSNINQ